MGAATYIQTSFLGGEWGPYAQGRMDSDRYRTGMNVCLNSIPVEEGAVTRRPGARLAAATRGGAKAVLKAFDFTQAYPYVLEITDGHLRFLSGGSLAVESASQKVVSNISAADPCVLTTSTAHGWSTGDHVKFTVDEGEDINVTLAPLLGRELEITVSDTDEFSVADALTGETIDGAAIVLGGTNCTVARIADLAVPYTEDQLDDINTAQDDSNLLFLHPDVLPRALTAVPPAVAGNFATFTLSEADFIDGPYLDPVTDGATVTPGATSGATTLTIAGGTTRWATTDVGRLVRLLSEPADYNAGTTYSAGDSVKYNGAYYVALSGSTGKRPDVSFAEWGADPTTAVWTWAEITGYTSATVVNATIRGATLPRTTACATWRLGLYSDTTGYPTCGVWHRGRLWLGGAYKNRVDASKSNSFFDFSPTASDGSVADDNAIAAILAATDMNQVEWMISDARGLVLGTQAGEWVIRASDLNDPITPTSIDADRVTEYGTDPVQAVKTGITISYVQRYGRKVIEYVTTDSRGYTGKNLSEKGSHLTAAGVLELAYVKEPVPILWGRTAEGKLIGCTYRRQNPFSSEEPDFGGWHRHELGVDFTVTSITAGPSFGGGTDSLSFVAYDPVDDYYYSYIMTPVFGQDDDIAEAYFVDHGVSPQMAQIVTVEDVQYIRLYSLWRLEGKTVAVFVGGIDAGDYLVVDGQVDVPLDGSIEGLTLAHLQGLSSETNWRGIGVAILLSAGSTAKPPSLNAIQTLSGTSVGTAGGHAAPDWERRRMYYSTGATAGSTLRSYDLDTFTVINSTTSGDVDTILVTDGDGFLYVARQSTIDKRDPDTLLVLDSVNIGQGNWLEQVATMNTAGGDNYILTQGQSFTFRVGNLTDMTYLGLLPDPDETGQGVITGGLEDAGTARGYIVAADTNATSPNTLPMGVYRVEVTPMDVESITKLGTFAPEDLPGWTHFNRLLGVLYDYTDDNLIVMAQASTAPTYSAATTYSANKVVKSGTKDYRSVQGGNLGHAVTDTDWWEDLGTSKSSVTGLFKVNLATMAVEWVVEMPSQITGGFYLNHSKIENGLMCFYASGSPIGGSNYRYFMIETLTGDYTYFDLFNTQPTYVQFGYDYTGENWFACSSNNDTLHKNNATPDNWTNQMACFTKVDAWPPADPPEASADFSAPVAVGLTYTSDGQILRAVAPAETGTRTGPGLGKTRRTHNFAALVHKTKGISFGTHFDKLRPALFATPGGRAYGPGEVFTGIWSTTLEDSYGYDSMLCWRVTRPYPATVLTIGGSLKTQDD